MTSHPNGLGRARANRTARANSDAERPAHPSIMNDTLTTTQDQHAAVIDKPNGASVIHSTHATEIAAQAMVAKLIGIGCRAHVEIAQPGHTAGDTPGATRE